MKMNRQVVLGFRNIGDSKDSGTVVSGPLNEVFRDLIQWLSTQELKKRIDICIGRDEKTVTNRIMGTAINKEIEAEEVFDAVADMMERVDAGESLMRSEEHTSELQSLMSNSYAVFCLKNTKQKKQE